SVYVLDLIEPIDALSIAERGAARVAVVPVILEVTRATRIAYPDLARRKIATCGGLIRSGHRNSHTHYAVGPTFVIDQAARPKLREREKARSLQERVAGSHISARWQICH